MKESTFDKHKLVVDEWFINGFNGVNAYMKYYPSSEYKSADSSFRKLVEKGRTKEYIESKMRNKSDELDITLSKQLKLLSDIIASAEKDSDKINAIKEQNKLLALYNEHNKQKQTDVSFILQDALKFGNTE